MNLYYDLHIHSCLSPCGDTDMTPGNIVGMAAVKGLDVIAVTDHNSCRNCPAVLRMAEEYGITAIAGMELTTVEEVHVVCLFAELANALAFDRYVYDKLQKIPNNPVIFGKQELRGYEDELIGEEPYLLINATEISFDEVFDLTASYGGIMIPAHIDKGSNSLMANLGFIPPDSRFACAEVKDLGKLHKLRAANPYLENCYIISDSDAHYLEHINEPVNTLYAAGKTAQEILDALVQR